MRHPPWRPGIPRAIGAALAAGILSFASASFPQNNLSSYTLAGLPAASPSYQRFDLPQVAPEIHRWYAPRHLAESYLQPWYATDTQYARDVYRRYVAQELEGEEWFDSFGRPLGRGWLLYTWDQEQKKRNGSQVKKTDFFGQTFQNLVIASDGDGSGTYRLMVGDGLDTRFTPLTFNKPHFNGLRLDYATDRYAASLILSRANRPDQAQQSNATHLVGGHLDLHLGLAKMGFTYVNAHNSQTNVSLTGGSPMRGVLTTGQNHSLQKLWVRIRDDSPEDRGKGATVFNYEIVLQDTSGRVLRGRDIGFLPRLEGGSTLDGAQVVSGSESLLLEYDLSSLDFEGVQSASIRRVTVELSIANDYRVEMASDLQTDGEFRDPEIVFFTVDRARGNVHDDSNGRLLRLDYGLPTGNELLGVNWSLVDWRDVSVQGEAVLNRRFKSYPNLGRSNHHQIVEKSAAAYAIAAYRPGFFGVFAEVFSFDDAYSTSYWLTAGNGVIRYKAPVSQLYEFVDDDDDYDGTPEWVRPFQPTSEEVAFPGFDENNDLIHDYNQNGGRPKDRNQNLLPDYDEAFLRFRSDRPDFLFGMDMNHNGTIDRFENDRLADYPYKRDHRGYNAYAEARLGDGGRLIVGRQDMRLMSGDGSTRSVYALGTWQRSLSRRGRLRIFEFAALVKDDIADDVQLWFQPVGAVGRMRDVPDLLPARNTWKNTLYADFDQRLTRGLRLMHRFKWEVLHQRRSRAQLTEDESRRRAGFAGLMNRAEWTLPVGLGVIEPRWKSEYRQDRPFSTRLPTARSLEETFLLLWTQPLFAESTSVNYFPRYGRQIFKTELQLGVELTRFWMLEGRREEVDEDFSGRTFVLQLTNRVGYQGYNVVTRTGMQFSRRNFETSRAQETSLLFITVNAGLM